MEKEEVDEAVLACGLRSTGKTKTTSRREAHFEKFYYNFATNFIVSICFMATRTSSGHLAETCALRCHHAEGIARHFFALWPGSSHSRRDDERHEA
jgi:hypothetical protein